MWRINLDDAVQFNSKIAPHGNAKIHISQTPLQQLKNHHSLITSSALQKESLNFCTQNASSAGSVRMLLLLFSSGRR
jgi:hypothetical protein